MKVRLKFDWANHGLTHKCGSVVDVSDRDGEALVLQGHEQVHRDTPSRKNPDLYTLGCVPSGPSIIGEIGVELVNIPPQKFGNAHSKIFKEAAPKNKD